MKIPGPVKCLTIESPTMITLFFVGTDLEFDLIVVVICSDLYVGLVFFLFISCITFGILLSVDVEYWMTTDEGSRIDLKKLLLFSKSEAIIFCLFLGSERRIGFSYSRNTSLVSRTLIVWLFFDSLLSFLSLSNRSNDISFFSS